MTETNETQGQPTLEEAAHNVLSLYDGSSTQYGACERMREALARRDASLKQAGAAEKRLRLEIGNTTPVPAADVDSILATLAAQRESNAYLDNMVSLAHAENQRLREQLTGQRAANDERQIEIDRLRTANARIAKDNGDKALAEIPEITFDEVWRAVSVGQRWEGTPPTDFNRRNVQALVDFFNARRGAGMGKPCTGEECLVDTGAILAQTQDKLATAEARLEKARAVIEALRSLVFRATFNGSVSDVFHLVLAVVEAENIFTAALSDPKSEEARDGND